MISRVSIVAKVSEAYMQFRQLLNGRCFVINDRAFEGKVLEVVWIKIAKNKIQQLDNSNVSRTLHRRTIINEVILTVLPLPE